MRRNLLGLFILSSPVTVFLVSSHYWGFWVGMVLGFAWLGSFHSFLEHVIPDQEAPDKPFIEIFRDMIHSFVYGITVGGLAVGCCWWLTSSLRTSVGFPLSISTWHFAFQIALVLLLGDLIDYARHYSEHQSSGVLWRIHSVHHSIRYFTTYTGSRLHPLEPILVYSGYGLIAGLLGCSFYTALTIFVVAMMIMSPQHLNVDTDIGWLRYVFVYTDAHRWHHDIDKIPACNYANVFTFWDILFGTFHQPHKFNGDMGVRPFEDDFPTALSTQAALVSSGLWEELESAQLAKE